MKCSGCGSQGFDPSPLGPGRCSFCDGTESDNPPTQQEIAVAEMGRARDAAEKLAEQDSQNILTHTLVRKLGVDSCSRCGAYSLALKASPCENPAPPPLGKGPRSSRITARTNK